MTKQLVLSVSAALLVSAPALALEEASERTVLSYQQYGRIDYALVGEKQPSRLTRNRRTMNLETDDLETRYPSRDPSYALNVFGLSHHPTGGKSKGLREINPGIGVRWWIDTRFLGARPYVETNLIVNNSKGGDSQTVGAGLDWDLYQDQKWRVYGGVQVLALRYHVPDKHRAMHGVLPVLHLAIARGRVGVHVNILPKQIALLHMSYDF